CTRTYVRDYRIAHIRASVRYASHGPDARAQRGAGADLDSPHVRSPPVPGRPRVRRTARDRLRAGADAARERTRDGPGQIDDAAPAHVTPTPQRGHPHPAARP